MLSWRLGIVLLFVVILAVPLPILALFPKIVSITVAVTESSASTANEVRSDFNGDGYEDLAIGVPGEKIGTADAAGAVNVIYGSASGLQTSSPADQFWNQASPGVNDSPEHGDQFGSSVAAGDFNNDGKDDLAIGVIHEQIGTLAAGAVNVLYGSSSGLQTSSPANQFWHQDKPGVEDAAENGDYFGLLSQRVS